MDNNENYEVDNFELIKQLGEYVTGLANMTVEYMNLVVFLQEHLESLEKLNVVAGSLDKLDMIDSIKFLKIYKELIVLSENLYGKYNLETEKEDEEDE